MDDPDAVCELLSCFCLRMDELKITMTDISEEGDIFDVK